jgi:hypothetical protein
MGLDAHVNRRGVHEDSAELRDSLIDKHLGNIAHVGFLRQRVNGLHNSALCFPIILQRVLYSGSHCGDEIGLLEIPTLMQELELLAKLDNCEEVKCFVVDMNELCKASIDTCNPIIF